MVLIKCPQGWHTKDSLLSQQEAPADVRVLMMQDDKNCTPRPGVLPQGMSLNLCQE